MELALSVTDAVGPLLREAARQQSLDITAESLQLLTAAGHLMQVQHCCAFSTLAKCVVHKPEACCYSLHTPAKAAFSPPVLWLQADPADVPPPSAGKAAAQHGVQANGRLHGNVHPSRAKQLHECVSFAGNHLSRKTSLQQQGLFELC